MMPFDKLRANEVPLLLAPHSLDDYEQGVVNLWVVMPSIFKHSPALIRVAAVSLLVLLAGCQKGGPNEQAAPEAAFSAFRDALNAGDATTIWAFLGDSTRSALEEQATALQALSDKTVPPASMLQTLWVPDNADIDTMERVEYDGNHALLRFTTVLGGSGEVRLQRADREWRIDLNLAPAQELAPSQDAAPAPSPMPAPTAEAPAEPQELYELPEDL